MHHSESPLRRAVRPAAFLVGIQLLLVAITAYDRHTGFQSVPFDSSRLIRELAWRVPLALIAGALYGIVRPRFSPSRGGSALTGLVVGAAIGVFSGLLVATRGGPVLLGLAVLVPTCGGIGALLSQFEVPRARIGGGARAG